MYAADGKYTYSIIGHMIKAVDRHTSIQRDLRRLAYPVDYTWQSIKKRREYAQDISQAAMDWMTYLETTYGVYKRRLTPEVKEQKARDLYGLLQRVSFERQWDNGVMRSVVFTEETYEFLEEVLKLIYSYSKSSDIKYFHNRMLYRLPTTPIGDGSLRFHLSTHHRLIENIQVWMESPDNGHEYPILETMFEKMAFTYGAKPIFQMLSPGLVLYE